MVKASIFQVISGSSFSPASLQFLQPYQGLELPSLSSPKYLHFFQGLAQLGANAVCI